MLNIRELEFKPWKSKLARPLLLIILWMWKKVES